MNLVIVKTFLYLNMHLSVTFLVSNSLYYCYFVILMGVLSGRAEPLFSHIYIIIYFCPLKYPSIFGLHTQHRCQKFRLASDRVPCIFIYALSHGLG